MNPKEREQKISYIKGQIEVTKSYILYWHASATTGVATMMDISRGMAPTEEERMVTPLGQVKAITSEVWSSNAGYKQLSDKEKIQDALNTMKAQIHRLSDLNEELYELLGMGE